MIFSRNVGLDRGMVWSGVTLKNSLTAMLSALLISSTAVAEKKEVEKLRNYSMRLAMETTASKETIWSLWEDVENWKQFDTLLEYSYLDEGDSFELGARGAVKAKDSPKTRFEITAIERGKSFTETLKLPLYQRIELHRYFLEDEDDNTVFVHEVRFRGRLKWFSHYLAAKTFRRELPLVMNRLRAVAEKKEATSRRLVKR